MTLAYLLLVLIAGGVLSLLAGKVSTRAPHLVSAATLAICAVLVGGLLQAGPQADGFYAELKAPWIPALGATLHLGLDGLSLLLVGLTLVVGALAVAAGWNEIHRRTGFFGFSLLWTLAGVVGVFMAFDLLLFFFFWEVMLVPMYFLIAVWGGEARQGAAMKFFLFTQISGLFMLVATVAYAYAYYVSTGAWSFNYFDLRELTLPHGYGMLVMLGFFIAFIVKLPGVPFHTWLPDTYTQAPTAGSIVLAGIMSKMGGYGLLRILLPMFPEAQAIAGIAMALGAATVVYGGVLAFAQTDFKRVVAYSSVAHMGFVLFGVFAWSEIAVQGTVVQMLAHGLSTGGLFLVAGLVCQRLQTRDLSAMGGIWMRAPRLGAIALFFVVAALGMPGLGNFVGEFLVLMGGFQVNATLTAVAAIGLVLSAMYALSLMQRAFQGTPSGRGDAVIADLGVADLAVLLPVMAALVWLGVYAQPVLDLSGPVVNALRSVGDTGVIAL
jgi:NADH-quinone oxidoreductase subunit M